MVRPDAPVICRWHFIWMLLALRFVDIVSFTHSTHTVQKTFLCKQQRRKHAVPSPRLALLLQASRREAFSLVLSTVTWLSIQDAAAVTSSGDVSVVESLREAETALQSLLDNWGRAVVDCTYADVPRELLESKNKEMLLEKASTFALFDKSVSVVSCKTSNRVVRDYLGRTGKGPLVGIDKKVRAAFDLVQNSDDLDRYVQASENLEQALSRADSLSYTAGVVDYNAINNFDKEDEANVLSGNSNLKQAKTAIEESLGYLHVIVGILPG